MSGKRVRGWWPLIAVAVVLVAAFWVLYVVWQSPHRSDLATYGAFTAAVITLLAGPIAWARRTRTNQAGEVAAGQGPDYVADLLAIAVKKQWETAAGERGLMGIEPIPVTWGRSSLPLTGPVAAAAGSQRFAPLPGLAHAGETRLAAGQVSDLHAVYGGLTSGRLVIAGAPGSGKSGAAVLLVLAALKYRDQIPAEDRPKVPVPVLLTAQEWDPRRQPVRAWLTTRLQETYPLFTGKTGAANAAGLIDAGNIALILDGLDEIAEELRPVAVQALSQQANFRVVVLSRTAEMASTAASPRGMLQGAAAVELRAIEPATAADYLERVQLDPPPEGWRELIDRIRTSQGSPIANALNNPLTLTLIRDTYESEDDARELLDFYDSTLQLVPVEQASEDITGHLLDRVLPSAYAHRPGQPPPQYDLQTAKNALEKIAARMKQDGTRDLQWWRIPKWASLAPRIILVGLGVGLVFGLGVGITVGLVFRFAAGLVFGLVAGLVFGLGAGLGTWLANRSSNDAPKRVIRPRLRRAFGPRILMYGPYAGLGAMLGGGLSSIVGGGARSAVLVTGLLFGFLGALGTTLVVGLREALGDPDSTSSASPVASWHSNRRYAVVLGSVVGLLVGLVVGCIFGFRDGYGNGVTAGYGLVNGLKIGLVMGLVVGPGTALVVGLSASRARHSSLAAVQLARLWHTPVRLMDFLDDARKRNVLRTVGPVYQFRHARLQDRLAAASADSSNDGNIDQPAG